ncbi:hypothetical protein [Listeria seeligeri]|uniref:hypothetical protein n=1 Tax=Listeria seeligeri TaxID=1640 RepID=UPI00162528EF|nr:hypothetical protein [Listeria seeligeri]MBF2673544.1 hypothetical protein [Listeria seeligeri]
MSFQSYDTVLATLGMVHDIAGPAIIPPWLTLDGAIIFPDVPFITLLTFSGFDQPISGRVTL